MLHVGDEDVGEDSGLMMGGGGGLLSSPGSTACGGWKRLAFGVRWVRDVY